MTDPDDRHESLRTQYAHLSSELRFNKENQWKVAYYSLLIDSAIVALFRLDLFPSGCIFRWITMSIAISCLILLAVFQVKVLIGNRDSAKKNRATLINIDKELNIETQDAIEQAKQERRDKLYTRVFIAVVSVSAGVAGAILLANRPL